MGNTNALGHHMSEEARGKISVAMMGHPFYGLCHAAPETRAKISAAMVGNKYALGICPSTETRAKLSVALMGHPFCGLEHHSPETRAKMSVAKWKGGPAGWKRRANAKRRGLGYVHLNEHFTGCEGHHVDGEQVIFMPHELHRSIYHRQDTGQGMAAINAIAYNFLFKQEAEAASGGPHGDSNGNKDPKHA